MAEAPATYQVKNFELPAWDTSNSCGQLDANFAEARAAEALEIAGAPINIFPLLGVHNQGSTSDLTGGGYPISSGTPSGYNVLDAFNSNLNVWQSVQTGQNVVITPSYIGYNFGTIKNLLETYDRYSNHASYRHHITTIKICQSNDPSRRALQVRIDRSDDGITWTRVDIVNLPNTGNLETIRIRQSAPSTSWRITPLMFTGVLTNQPWEVSEIQLLEETSTSLDTIQDSVLMENRDRAYSKVSTQLKAHYDLMDVQSELSRFGIDIPAQYIFNVSYDVMICKLGRPVVIGDIVEMPTEVQYDNNLSSVKRWLEVIDAGWSTEGYTANWRPVLYRFFAQPLNASMEHRDILGTPNNITSMTDGDFLTGDFPFNVNAFEATDQIKAEAAIAVPMTGEDGTNIQRNVEDSFTGPDTGTVHITNVSPADHYQCDGLPPNNLPYTEGETYPKNPADGAYHRITYPAKLAIPARLFQWSVRKNTWVFKEQDERGNYNSHKPSLKRIISSPTRMNLTD